MQFGSGVQGAEPPVDGGLCRIAPGLIGVDGSLQSGSIGITPLETGPGQHAELNLRHPFGKLRTGLSQLACLGVW